MALLFRAVDVGGILESVTVTGAALARQRQTEQCTQEYTPRRPRDVISEVLTEELWIRDRIEDSDRARASPSSLSRVSKSLSIIAWKRRPPVF
jgi:hypothetical protein